MIGITSKLMEAKSTKSYDSYAILAKFVAKGSLGLVISPLRGVGHLLFTAIDYLLKLYTP